MASQDWQLTCAIDLMRRLPPQQIEKNLADLIDLVPSLCEDLLSAVDQPLRVARDKETGKDYLLCDYNRDGDSYRSPWSNKYDPPLSDGAVSSDRVRRMEIEANQAFDIYRELYFESGVCSVYMWERSESPNRDQDLDHGIAAVIVIKKAGDTVDVKGCWDSIHVMEVEEKAQGLNANYKLTSTVMLWLQTIKADSGTMNLGGSLTRQVSSDHAVSDSSSHIANIGRMVEDMENKMRQLLNETYFIKTKDMFYSLRSVGQKALTLTKEHVKNAFEKTSDLTYLCSGLDIPDDKWNVSSAVEYCTQSTDPRKGRKMVYWLDMIGDTALADTVMECAEPPADPSLTPHNLIPVFQALTGDWEKISGSKMFFDYTIVPEARARLFREKVSARDQLCSEAGKYYALYHEDPNWKELSRWLSSAGETEALQIARPHIQTVAAPQSSSGSGQSTETGEGDTAQHGASASGSSQLTTQSTAENTPTTRDERPKLPKLLCFRTSTGTLNVTQRVGTKFTDLGVILLDDEDGTIVEGITYQFRENPVKITQEILTRWIRGEGIEPVTWKTLIDTLQKIGLVALATSIEQGL